MLEMQLNGGVCTPKGFRGAGVKAGIKASGNHDLALLASDVPARCFGVFTLNQVKAAPVLYDQEVLSRSDRISAVLVNSGNANACTGPDGWADAKRMAQVAESALGLGKDSVLVCSTGIIGRKLPIEKIEVAVPAVHEALSHEGSEAFARAIMTTDTKMKTLGAVLTTSEGEIRIGGACKGSGMIHPNMATMLAYITTDIELPPTFRPEFKAWVNESFNAISVDGDMSTNDTCILLANGASGISYHNLSLSEQGEFRRAIESVMLELALMIVRDGEGATRMVEIRVEKATSKDDARKIGRFVCTSNLVKTAMFGQDPNWGRILSSAGSAGGELIADRTDLFFEDVQVLRGGRPLDVDYTRLREVVARKEYRITLVLNMGDSSASSYTCDLSYDYVKINAEYTT
jgi:glutamate N-acetyltransferase/amino-acid N-acetyltransferase